MQRHPRSGAALHRRRERPGGAPISAAASVARDRRRGHRPPGQRQQRTQQHQNGRDAAGRQLAQALAVAARGRVALAQPQQLAPELALERLAQVAPLDPGVAQRVGAPQHLVAGPHVGDLDGEDVAGPGPLGPADQERGLCRALPPRGKRGRQRRAGARGDGSSSTSIRLMSERPAM